MHIFASINARSYGYRGVFNSRGSVVFIRIQGNCTFRASRLSHILAFWTTLLVAAR